MPSKKTKFLDFYTGEFVQSLQEEATALKVGVYFSFNSNGSLILTLEGEEQKVDYLIFIVNRFIKEAEKLQGEHLLKINRLKNLPVLLREEVR
jgi:acylphosphatase